jgi:hypothetical protein
MMVLPWTLDSGFWPGEWGGKAGTCAFVGCRILSKICIHKATMYYCIGKNILIVIRRYLQLASIMLIVRYLHK